VLDPATSILVTGGAGFIGSHVAWQLVDAGYRVVVLDDLSSGSEALVPIGAVLVVGCVSNVALVEALIRQHEIGAIVHLAGSTVVAESVADPLKYYDNNTVRSRALLAAAVGSGVPLFVFSSTAAVYGVPQSLPVAEDAPTAPVNPYGRSKLMTEWILRDCAAAHSITYGVLRYFNVAGADPARRTGQSTANATSLIKVAVEAATGQREHVCVFGTDFETPDGTGVRDYIHVADLTDAHVTLLHHLAAHPGRSETLNCGYGRGYSVQEVLDVVDRAAGRPVTRRIGPRRPGDPANVVADSSALMRIGWRPRHADLETIVGDTLAWERRQLGHLARA
jgi:UDP-glucose 4-epimerase